MTACNTGEEPAGLQTKLNGQSAEASAAARRGKLPLRHAVIAASLAFSLGSCSGSLDPASTAKIGGEQASPAQIVSGANSLPSDEPYRLGLEHFNRGDYGLSERYFREAVEKAPKDSASWIGLAASYDRMRRFDLADRAYQTAIKLSGETVQILNNQGFSYMLRGNLKVARVKFMKARALEPDNPTLQNNLKLLNDSAKYIKRDAL
ncbi:MAG: tetratricopeptide repeat protein [Rhodomicrobium sp.]